MKRLNTLLLARGLGTGGTVACFGAAAGAPPLRKPPVSQEAAPLVVIEPPTRDGHKALAVMRTPPGEGRRATIIFLHGGLNQWGSNAPRQTALSQPTQGRFLAAGYLTVAATFRSRRDDPQTRDALVECLAVIDCVKQLPQVDPRSVVRFGGSGGGRMETRARSGADPCRNSRLRTRPDSHEPEYSRSRQYQPVGDLDQRQRTQTSMP